MGTRASDVAREIERMRNGMMPKTEPMALINNGASVQQTIMEDAMAAVDVSAGDTVPQIWLPEQEVVVIDLSGGDQKDE